MKLSEVFEQCANEIEAHPDMLTARAWARDADGRKVPPLDEKASCWCSSGLLLKKLNQSKTLVATPSGKQAAYLYGDAAMSLFDVRSLTVGSPGSNTLIMDVNDTFVSENHKDKVVAIFRKGAELAKQRRL